MPEAHLHHLGGKCVLPVHGANFPPPRCRWAFMAQLVVWVSRWTGRTAQNKLKKWMRRAQECLLEFLVCSQASFSVKAGRCPSQMERKVLSCCVTRESLFNNTWPRMSRLAHRRVVLRKWVLPRNLLKFNIDAKNGHIWKESPFPNQRRPNTHSDVKAYPCTFGGTRIGNQHVGYLC